MYADRGNWTDWKRSMDELLKWDFDEAIPGPFGTFRRQHPRHDAGVPVGKFASGGKTFGKPRASRHIERQRLGG
jgi:hypothetical protein